MRLPQPNTMRVWPNAEPTLMSRAHATWTVSIEGPAQLLSTAAVEEWMALLQRVPSGESALTGFGINDP